MVVQFKWNNNLIFNTKITCIGLFCLIASDFFVITTIIIRNKSPPTTVEFSKNLIVGGLKWKVIIKVMMR